MRRSISERLLAKIKIEGDCWLWTGSQWHGYGQIRISRKWRKAYRVSYEEFIGPVPAGLELDHVCRRPECINPAHLEPVTHRENILRGSAPAALQARKTHCVNGHPLSGENLRLEGRHRRCRICAIERARRWRDLRRFGGAA
jgi:hypothetical protein